jgi:AraC-like DNA-binding protein
VGCLSIKTVLKGTEWYGVGPQQIAVRPGQFLVLNDDQEYACRVDRDTPATILSVFFGASFAASTLLDGSRSEESSLDNFHIEDGAPPEFFQTLNPITETLAKALTQLTMGNGTVHTQNDTDEALVFLLRELLQTHHTAGIRVNQVKSIKTATRLEVYKRLCVAKDFMHGMFMDRVDLSSISQAAGMSIPQLVRQFKAAFHITPHQYLTQIRLGHAAELLKRSDISIHEIIMACGFENTSSFGRLFKNVYGRSPMSFRTTSIDN